MASQCHHAYDVSNNFLRSNCVTLLCNTDSLPLAFKFKGSLATFNVLVSESNYTNVMEATKILPNNLQNISTAILISARVKLTSDTT